MVKFLKYKGPIMFKEANHNCNNLKINKNDINKLYLFALIEGTLLGLPFAIFGALIPVMSEDLSLAPNFMGLVMAGSYFGGFITVFIAGNLIELIGIKKVVFISIVLLVCGMIMISFAKTQFIFALSYFLAGFGVGGLEISLNFITSSIYSKERSRKLLLMAIFIFIGSITGYFFTRVILVTGKSWRLSFFVIGILFILSLVFVFMVDFSKIKIFKKKKNLNHFLKNIKIYS